MKLEPHPTEEEKISILRLYTTYNNRYVSFTKDEFFKVLDAIYRAVNEEVKVSIVQEDLIKLAQACQDVLEGTQTLREVIDGYS